MIALNKLFFILFERTIGNGRLYFLGRSHTKPAPIPLGCCNGYKRLLQFRFGNAKLFAYHKFHISVCIVVDV